MAHDPITSFITTYVDALRDQSAALFAGAGLSIPAGIVNWKELLRDIAGDVGLNVDKEHDLVSVAQYHFNKQGRHKINQKLVDEFSTRARLTDNHTLLASLPIRTYWTTNYDTLIEQSLKEAGKTPDVKITPESLATTLHRRDATVYKMHGDVSQAEKAVVTKEDYELYSTTRQLFSTALQGDLVSKTFLFIGFSFSDPNLAYVLARIRVLLGTNVRHHYCLIRQVHRKDFDKTSDFTYARAKLELQIDDLRRYGIHGLVVKDHSDYTTVLQRLSRAFRRSRVFVSGSAVAYGPWTQPQAEQLISEISRQLTQYDFDVVSGSGVGVGASVANGVLEQLDRDNTRVIDERLIVRPFPQHITNPATRARRWREYRQQILCR
jgi:hypothetical protein